MVLCGTDQTTGILATGVSLSVETVPRGSSGGGSLSCSQPRSTGRSGSVIQPDQLPG